MHMCNQKVNQDFPSNPILICIASLNRDLFSPALEPNTSLGAQWKLYLIGLEPLPVLTNARVLPF